MEIQKLKIQLPDGQGRMETGPVQFTYQTGEEDWPGFFIRGDNAFALRLAIAQVLVNAHDPFARAQLHAYMEELDSCNMNQNVVQHLKEMYTNGGKDGAVAGPTHRP